MILDLSSLEAAVGQLAEALELAEGDLARSDARLDRHLRAAAIQAFAYTYELTVKMLRRWLTLTEASADLIEGMTFNQLIRLAWERGRVAEELAVWTQFRASRGTTSHTYDRLKADQVYAVTPRFLVEARTVLARLQHGVREDG